MLRFNILFHLILGFSIGCSQFTGVQYQHISASLSPAQVLELQSQTMSIFQNRCSSCHNDTISNGGLGNVASLNHLLSEGFVIPGDTTNSILYNAIEDNRMPQGGALSESEKTVIQKWIALALPRFALNPVAFTTTQSIIQTRCLACHSAAGANQGGINLETFANVRSRVVPGRPYQSALFDSVLKNRMPVALDKLTQRELGIIYNWILLGAQESVL